MNVEKYKLFLLKFGYWAAISAIIYIVFRYIFVYTIPFLIALTVAALLQPAVRYLSSKFKINRDIIGLVLVILACIIIAGILLLISSKIILGIVNLVEASPKIFTNYVEPALSKLGKLLESILSRFDQSSVNIINNSMPEIISSFRSTVTNSSVSMVKWVSGVAVGVPGTLLATIICVIATVFMTVDYDKITATFKKILPNRAVFIFVSAKSCLKSILGNFAKSYLLIMIITFAEIAVGLLIIGVNKAVIIALIIAGLDILPIIGSGLILMPWIIITFIQGDIGRGLGLLALYIVVVIVRQIIEPKIVGKAVGLHPIVTLFCMWLGVKLFGGIGLFALPITFLIIKQLIEIGVIGKLNENNGESSCT